MEINEGKHREAGSLDDAGGRKRVGSVQAQFRASVP